MDPWTFIASYYLYFFRRFYQSAHGRTWIDCLSTRYPYFNGKMLFLLNYSDLHSSTNAVLSYGIFLKAIPKLYRNRQISTQFWIKKQKILFRCRKLISRLTEQIKNSFFIRNKKLCFSIIQLYTSSIFYRFFCYKLITFQCWLVNS